MHKEMSSEAQLERLFREEAMKARQRSQLGSTNIPTPVLALPGLILTCVVILSFLTLAYFGKYERTVHALGKILPSQGIIAITSLGDGYVTKIFVKNNSLVKKGAPLFQISTERYVAGYGDASARISGFLTEKRKRVDRALDTLTTSFATQHAALVKQLDLQSRKFNEIQKQKQIQTQRAASAMALYARWQNAKPDGVVSKLQLLQQHDQALQAKTQVSELKTRELEAAGQIAELTYQISNTTQIFNDKTLDLRRQLSDIDKEELDNAASGSIILKSTADGRIDISNITVGSSVKQGQVVANLLPTITEWIGEAWLTPADVTNVRPGLRATLQFHGEYGAELGQITTHVVSISDVPLYGDQKDNTGENKQFLVKIYIPNAAYKIPDGQSLTVGVPFDAQIATGEQGIGEWLLNRTR